MDIQQGMEATLLPISLTTDWQDDGNETIGNQFQQPDWQVGNLGSFREDCIECGSESIDDIQSCLMKQLTQRQMLLSVCFENAEISRL